MKVKISPSICNGNVIIPPSKSMAHRSIICASLANGKSTIKNIAYSQDILATIEGMKKLGAKIEMKEDYVVIEGIKDFSSLQSKEIFCNESGWNPHAVPEPDILRQIIEFFREDVSPSQGPDHWPPWHLPPG